MTYMPVAADKAPLEIGMNEDGSILIDTTGSINLPDLTIDPRDGGEYSSEIGVIQQVLDLVQLAQDQVPAPIQTGLTDIYNNTTEGLPRVD